MSRPDKPPQDSIDDPRLALRQLTGFAQSMLLLNSLDDLLWDIAAKVGELLGFEDCVVYLAADDQLIQSAAFGVKADGARTISNPIIIPFGHGIVGAAAASGQAQRVQAKQQLS